MYILFFILVGIIVIISQEIPKNKKLYIDELETSLKGSGYKVILSRYPGILSVGPFPKFEISKNNELRIKSNLRGSGRYSIYKIVQLIDGNGLNYTLWARIKFSSNNPTFIQWRTPHCDVPIGLSNLINVDIKL